MTLGGRVRRAVMRFLSPGPPFSAVLLSGARDPDQLRELWVLGLLPCELGVELAVGTFIIYETSVLANMPPQVVVQLKGQCCKETVIRLGMWMRFKVGCCYSQVPSPRHSLPSSPGDVLLVIS